MKNENIFIFFVKKFAKIKKMIIFVKDFRDIHYKPIKSNQNVKKN